MSAFSEAMSYIVAIVVALGLAFTLFWWKDNIAFETTTIETLPDGRSWVCYQKREQWRGAISTHCLNWSDFSALSVSRYEK